MPGAVPLNPPIFHITHVENLPSIVAHGCLWSDSQRIARNLETTNIGYSHIKQRRLNRLVTAGVGGKLGDYVPFNFCPRSVMLFGRTTRRRRSVRRSFSCTKTSRGQQSSASESRAVP
jgi:hypothetical protein